MPGEQKSDSGRQWGGSCDGECILRGFQGGKIRFLKPVGSEMEGLVHFAGVPEEQKSNFWSQWGGTWKCGSYSPGSREAKDRFLEAVGRVVEENDHVVWIDLAKEDMFTRRLTRMFNTHISHFIVPN